MLEDGRAVIASCSNVILTHEIERRDPILQFQPHEGLVNCVVWNHNNLVLASCGNDGKIILSHSRKHEKDQILLQFEDEISQSSPLTSIQFTSVSSKLASGGSNGKVKIFDLKNKCIAKTYSSHYGGVTSVDWHQNDYIIASSSQVGDIFLHNVENDQQVATFSENVSVQSIKFSPFRNNQLASCCGDGSVSIWDINSKSQIANFQKHESKVNSVAFSPQNRVLATSASLDMNINFYDINEKKVVKTLPCDQPLTSLAFHNDGHTIIVGTLYGNMIVYDLRKGSEARYKLEGHAQGQPVNHISVIKQIDKNKQSQVSNNSQTSQKVQPSTNNSRFQEQPNYQNNQNINMPQNPQTLSQQFQQGSQNRLNDTVSSVKSKGQDNLPPNPARQNNLDGNLSDREYSQKPYNNTLSQPSPQQLKNSNVQMFQVNGNQIQKFGLNNQQSPAPSTKQSQILTNNTNINNSSITGLNGKTSQIISNPQQEFRNPQQQQNQQIQRKQSYNLQDEEYKNQNQLNKNYSSKHLYNQNQVQNISAKQSQIQLQNQSSNSKIQSPQQDDYQETKKSGLTNVQPYELPPKSSTIIERHSEKSLAYQSALGDDFTDKQKQYIKNLLEDQYLDIKFHFQEQFQNLHIEIIRQFQIQHNDMGNLLEQYVNKNQVLEEKMKQLQLENERLKKSTY